MHNYSIQTTGTAMRNVQGDRFYLQDGYFWFVDEEANCIFAIDARGVQSVELVK